MTARSETWVCYRFLAGIEAGCSNPAWGLDVCFECCVLSGRGLCYGPIIHPEESYRLWCVRLSPLKLVKNEAQVH